MQDMKDVDLSKKKIDDIVNEWYKIYMDKDAYITKIKSLGDKEFLKFCTYEHIILIGDGLAIFNDIRVQVMEYPKIREANESDIKKYLGKMHIFKNQARGISLQFHIKSDELDFYMTFVLEAEILPEDSSDHGKEIDNFKILGFDHEDLIRTQKEIDEDIDWRKFFFMAIED